MPEENAIHVVAAVIRDPSGRVLIQKRPAGKVAAGLWEFPGGKVDAGEGRFAALQRELDEELGLLAGSGRPLLRLVHRYTHAVIDLDVWEVTAHAGRATGRENQEIRWVAPGELRDYEYPAANLPVVDAILLPDHLMVTPDGVPGPQLVRDVAAAVERGVRLVQLRAHALDDDRYAALAREVHRVCRAQDAKLLINRDPAMLERVAADGVHLTGARLMQCRTRPVSRSTWLSASVHDAAQVEQARCIGVDFVSLGPVRETASHPQARPLGWAAFERLAGAAGVPVYAQGGLDLADYESARRHGARGVAGIRLFHRHDVVAAS